MYRYKAYKSVTERIPNYIVLFDTLQKAETRKQQLNRLSKTKSERMFKRTLTTDFLSGLTTDKLLFYRYSITAEKTFCNG